MHASNIHQKGHNIHTYIWGQIQDWQLAPHHPFGQCVQGHGKGAYMETPRIPPLNNLFNQTKFMEGKNIISTTTTSRSKGYGMGGRKQEGPILLFLNF